MGLMHPPAGAGRGRQHGLTLIELMISITLGLIILAALGYTYVGSRGAYRSSENLARMQEGGRLALQILTEDLRMSSFYGCRSRIITGQEITVVANPAPPVVASLTAPPVGVQGCDGSQSTCAGVTFPSTTPRIGGTDVIRIWRAEARQSAPLVATTDTAARTAQIANNRPNFQTNDLVLLANCDGAVIFKVTNSPGTATPASLAYAASGNSASFPAIDVASHATAYRFSEAVYYVGRSTSTANRRPGLFRMVDGGAAEELVDNIEDFDVVYGVDTDADFRVDAYRRADEVTDWSQVIAVRVGVLVAGPEAGAGTAAQTYRLRDTDNDGTLDAQTAADTRLRQVFTSTVAIRNRTQ